MRTKLMVRATAAMLAAGMAAGMALAGASTAQATPAAAAPVPTWHLVYRSHYALGDQLADITAPARDDAWAVGSANLKSGTKAEYLHWDGRTWRSVTITGTRSFTPQAVAASSPGNVWIFGGYGPLDRPAALVYNGKAWKLRSLPVNFDWDKVAVLSATNVWVALTQGPCKAGTPAPCTILEHWNGTRWSSVQVPGYVQATVRAGGHAWFLTLTRLGNPTGIYSGAPVIYETAGNALRTVPAPAIRIMEFASLAAAPNGHLWLQGSLTGKGHPARMWQSSRRAWTLVAIPANVCQPGTGGFCPLQIYGPLTYDGANGAWAGPFAHWTGTHWVNADNYFPQLIPGFGIHAFTVFPGTTGIWAVGVIDTSAAGGLSDLIARFY
jgi:hypothetical protein